MPRHSRSSPRRQLDAESSSLQYAETHRPRNRYAENSGNRNDSYSFRRHDGADSGRTERAKREDYRREYEGHPREYGERERERERQRDRDRYDKDRQRDRGASRRSASPRRSRSVRSTSRDRSPEGDKNKGKPNFAPSGLLAAETNTVKASNGENTVLKYNEPPEARKPTLGWRLYVFKGDEQTDLLHVHRQSAYLVGRDRLVADIAIDHPSCSKQHAVIQYRLIQEKNEFGDTKATIKPFIIDLESTNGTHVNGITIPTARFYELKPSDVIKFGTSAREYVLLHDEAV
ncbi:hypothetical protein AMATHDRAFT_53539 [Amanita thiersii Skay4041]|uniref:FHA domain-containing protein n=1 Tax=Amanita thiersii Skay4041 TaxID=703135 RepID=A0A2A9NWS0_9AGAR|nr:hypothetical protein AMATHDRAFT_53539 [Amanita thiersii Skay4041]